METDSYSERNDLSEEENEKSKPLRFDKVRVNTFSDTSPI
jgi:hypothetical protein